MNIRNQKLHRKEANISSNSFDDFQEYVDKSLVHSNKELNILLVPCVLS